MGNHTLPSNAMATDTIETRNSGVEMDPLQNDKQRMAQPTSSGEAPSGFILKLFQMVNGAPDEVIAWTQSGDAFIIGSDLQRLESETLPQFFRHNRFQSLVRQLNFYSFRKINRERNVWIYKHELFHRDRPHDLHLVRRRTCPGLDGRKQRFSRFAPRRMSEIVESSKADDSSLDSSEEPENAENKRIGGITDQSRLPPAKRARELWNGVGATSKKEHALVDTSIVQATKQVRVHEVDDQTSLATSNTARVDMIEQSMAVSEVALKLEQLSKKANKGRGGSRARRSGVVTPPYGTPSFSVLTYDDEYVSGTRRGSAAGISVDEEESMRSGKNPAYSEHVETATVTPSKEKDEAIPPIMDPQGALALTNRFLERTQDYSHRAALISPTSVARFCMSTSPVGDKDLCSKILHLIASCSSLATEFQLYRSALHPVDAGDGPALALSSHTPMDVRPVTVQQIWEREASRGDAVRDFKTFALNCIHTLLGKNGRMDAYKLMTPDEKTFLERTADLWLTSVRVEP